MAIDLLPTELFDHIIKYVQDDRVTLYAISQTSHTFHSLARLYIFNRVYLHNHSKFNVFLSLLDSTPSIRPIVKSLTILASNRLPWILRFPVDLAPKLPNLETIQWVGLWDRHEFCTPELFSAFSKFSTVKKLCFDECALSSHDIISFACSMPNVKHFRIDNAYELTDSSFSSSAKASLSSAFLPASLKLTTLRLFGHARAMKLTGDLLGYILSTDSKDTLREVRIGFSYREVVPVGKLLQAVGPNLEHLELLPIGFVTTWQSEDRFSHPWDLQLFEQHINLRNMQNLCSFTLHDPITTIGLDGIIDKDACEAKCSLISQISSPRFTTLAFHVHFTKSTSYRAHFGPLAEQLLRITRSKGAIVNNDGTLSSSGPGINIQQVLFRYMGSLDVRRATGKLQRAFPDLHAKGLLKVDCVCVDRCLHSVKGRHVMRFY
ncbi:hypothetical protein C8Q75DRAFT_535695 [Abortiporus biennis]|nr:hypothetical protein C8Q75DRAFT_535695 [Abortiporus biennis]